MPLRRTPLALGLALVAAGLVLPACGAGVGAPGAREAGIGPLRRRRAEEQEASRPMNQAELNQRLERAAAGFISDLNEAREPLLDTLEGRKRTSAAKLIVVYFSSVLDIASGVEPEVNLLDMIAFAELAGGVVRDHWLAVYGEKSRPLLEAFEGLERDTWEIASEVLTDPQEEKLRGVLAEWREQNEGRIHVEGLRLEDFALVAGAAAETRAAEARGLLSTMKAGLQTADQGILLAQSGLFLAQRMPFLLRAHVGVFLEDTKDDAREIFEELEASMAHAEQLGPMLEDVQSLLTHAAATSRDAQALTEAMTPLVERAAGLVESGKLEATLDKTDRITDRTLRILERLHDLSPESPDALAAVEDRVDAMMRRAALYAALAGAAVAIVFWAGYVVAKRLAPRA